MNKLVIQKTLRTLKLLSLADKAYFYKVKARFTEGNRRFVLANPKVRIPPDEMLYESLGNNSYDGYWKSGLSDSKWLFDIIKKKKPTKELRIIEWGCGPARVIRHLKTLDKSHTFYGFDYSGKFIDWCKKNINDCFFIKNNLSPPLKLESSTVDVFYCVSVFTHLSEKMHTEWIKEIWRLLKPGGLFIVTFHGEKFKERLLPSELTAFENDGFVIRGNVPEGSKDYAAYQSSTFIKEKLLKNFVEVSEVNEAPFHQNVWCGVKPTLEL